MYKANNRFGNLTRGQMRDIHLNREGRTEREAASFYGVPVKVIRGVKITVGRSRAAWRAGHAA